MIVILTACDRGVPLTARCEICGAMWRRPDGDRHADDLVRWGRTHNKEMHISP